MSFVIPARATPSVAVEGSAARFPVQRIFCVGRNYAAHIREMGNDERDPPFFFTKPADAVIDSGAKVPYPPLTRDLHHEVELVLAIGTGGANITEGAALDHIWGYGVGCDLTRRDLQAQAKKAGRPWDWAKAFDASAPCGPLRQGPLPTGAIRFTVNGGIRQEADLAEMIWTVPEIVAICSQAVRLEPGDLILTGTPAGVGPLKRGDVCEGEIEGLAPLSFTLA